MSLATHTVRLDPVQADKALADFAKPGVMGLATLGGAGAGSMIGNYLGNQSVGQAPGYSQAPARSLLNQVRPS